MDQNTIDRVKSAASQWLAPISQRSGGRFTPQELNAIANAIVGALMEYELHQSRKQLPLPHHSFLEECPLPHRGIVSASPR